MFMSSFRWIPCNSSAKAKLPEPIAGATAGKTTLYQMPGNTRWCTRLA
jgi:hypothetical protein